MTAAPSPDDPALGPDDPNIVLTGFMGTGKTSVGRALAALLSRRFVDTDAMIEVEHGPIPAIFERHGEDHFRALERQVALDLSQERGLVISTGGRLMLDPENQATLGGTGLVVTLTATADEILTRLQADGGIAQRPMLAGADPRARIDELLQERGPLYAVFHQVPTGGRTPADIVAEIIELARRRGNL